MIEISLPWPPSVNHYWRTPRTGSLAGRTMISEQGRRYREEVWRQVIAQRVKAALTTRLRVEIAAHPPDRRRRDLDNLQKALLDGLTHAGVWADDAQIDDLRIFRADPIMGMVKVKVWELEQQPCSES